MNKEEAFDGLEFLWILNLYEFFSKKMPMKEDKQKLFNVLFKGYLRQSERKNLK